MPKLAHNALLALKVFTTHLMLVAYPVLTVIFPIAHQMAAILTHAIAHLGFPDRNVNAPLNAQALEACAQRVVRASATENASH